MLCHETLFSSRFITLSFLFLLSSCSTHVKFRVQGRANLKSISIGFPQTAVNEEMAIWNAQIGSRPPRCERKCTSCGHCEAIQVPTNPQVNKTNKNYPSSSRARGDVTSSSRGDESSNYKPMTWKCKCGNFIFNP